MKNQVCVSVLGTENKADKINQLIKHGVKTIHYDLMDGLFVKNKSLEQSEMEYILANTNDHFKDLHLMVFDPVKYIDLYKHRVDSITFHYESESIDKIKKIFKNYGHQFKIGIAVNPGTNIEQIFEFVHDASHVLIMSVVPGKGGQTFIDSTIEKIVKLKNYITKIKADTFIQVDGGINDQTGPRAFKAGATSLVSGSFVLKNINQNKILEKIKGHN